MKGTASVKKTFICFVLIIIKMNVFALDIQYTGIVNTALSDLKTHSKLSLLQGHVAINISSGNKDLDIQFAESLQKAYPNFASKAGGSVHYEDLYQMTVKVYRENNDVYSYTTVTNFEQKNIVERTVKAKSVSAAVLETIQYKTAIHAKNEFEAYLDSAFDGTGAVVQEARPVPPPPPKPPFDWSPFTHYEGWFDLTFGASALFESGFLLAMPQIGLEWGGLDGVIKRWRFGTYISLPGYAHYTSSNETLDTFSPSFGLGGFIGYPFLYFEGSFNLSIGAGIFLLFSQDYETFKKDNYAGVSLFSFNPYAELKAQIIRNFYTSAQYYFLDPKWSVSIGGQVEWDTIWYTLQDGWDFISEFILPTFDWEMVFGFGIGTNLNFNSITLIGFCGYFYWDISIGLQAYNHSAWLDENWEYNGSSHYSSSNGKELVEYETTPFRFELGAILPYNEYLKFLIGIGAEFNIYWDDYDYISNRVEDEYGTSWGFVVSPGVMLKIKSLFIIGRYTFGKHEIDNNFEFILGWAF